MPTALYVNHRPSIENCGLSRYVVGRADLMHNDFLPLLNPALSLVLPGLLFFHIFRENDLVSQRQCIGMSHLSYAIDGLLVVCGAAFLQRLL